MSITHLSDEAVGVVVDPVGAELVGGAVVARAVVHHGRPALLHGLILSEERLVQPRRAERRLRTVTRRYLTSGTGALVNNL